MKEIIEETLESNNIAPKTWDKLTKHNIHLVLFAPNIPFMKQPSILIHIYIYIYSRDGKAKHRNAETNSKLLNKKGRLSGRRKRAT